MVGDDYLRSPCDSLACVGCNNLLRVLLSAEGDCLLSMNPAVINFCHIGDYASFFILGITP